MASPSCCCLLLLLPLLLLHVFLFFHSCSAFSGDSNHVSELVTQVCQQTKTYAFCVEILDSDPRAPKADIKGLARISLNLSFLTASGTKEYISYLLTNTTDPGVKQGLNHCLLNYGGAIEAIKRSVFALDTRKYQKMSEMVGVASENAFDCERAFSEGPTPPPLLTAKNTRLEKLCEISNVITQILLKRT